MKTLLFVLENMIAPPFISKGISTEGDLQIISTILCLLSGLFALIISIIAVKKILCKPSDDNEDANNTKSDNIEQQKN